MVGVWRVKGLNGEEKELELLLHIKIKKKTDMGKFFVNVSQIKL